MTVSLHAAEPALTATPTLLAASAGGAGVPLREIALVILIAVAATYLTTGIVRWIVVRMGVLDDPRARDVHTIPKPRLGGVAMFTGFLAAWLMAQLLPALTRGFPPVTPDMLAVLVASFIIVGVGILDDIFDLDAVTKLVGQIVAALVMSMMGLSGYLFYLPFIGGGTTVVLDPVLSTIFTVLLTVTLINAINFVDGLDGLAASLGFIAALAILLYSLTVLHDQGGAVSAYPPAMISAALVGMCIGFLPHNFEPARIFMGDSGAMLIGLLLSAACVSASGRLSLAMYGTADVFALISPFIIVAAAVSVPVLDLLLAVVRRTSKGKSPFSADKMHLHHRLLDMGHSHRRVVLVLCTWVTVVAFAAVGTTMFPTRFVVVGFALGIVGAMLFTFLPGLRGSKTVEAGESVQPQDVHE